MSGTGDNVGAGQIKAFVERILRMKEEARAIKDDIREIYAEAKGNGFDKTVLGQIVGYVEKRQKDPDTLAERNALFDLYLEAFDGSSHARARTRENIEEFGAQTAATPNPADAGHNAGGSHEDLAPQLIGSETADHSTGPAAVKLEPMAAGADAGLGSGSGASASDVEVVALVLPQRRTAAENARSIRPYCQHADDLSKCAGMGRKHCYACQKLHADEIGDAA